MLNCDMSQGISTVEEQIISAVKPFTMTPPARALAVLRAVEYIEKTGCAGDIVECGVWRGGIMMAVALALRNSGAATRKLYLYDTFDGMSAPTAVDVDYEGKSATAHLSEQPKNKDNHYWAYSPIDDVQRNVLATGYPSSHVQFVKGRVEDTIPGVIPDQIALLRLDTDWYESTKHELIHLYPRLVQGGILILDDYGSWQGARRAVDEYFAMLGAAPVMVSVRDGFDDSSRICIKP